MSKYVIELIREVDAAVKQSAKQRGLTVEAFIESLLSQFSVPPHTMKEESLKDGYEKTGGINLEWANLK